MRLSACAAWFLWYPQWRISRNIKLAVCRSSVMRFRLVIVLVGSCSSTRIRSDSVMLHDTAKARARASSDSDMRT